jgi:hypothetical protein
MGEYQFTSKKVNFLGKMRFSEKMKVTQMKNFERKREMR